MVIFVASFAISLLIWATFDLKLEISRLEKEKNKKLLDMINRNLRDIATLKPSREEELLKWNTPKTP